MVPEGGIEPPQDESYTALNRARLPVPPFRQVFMLKFNIYISFII